MLKSKHNKLLLSVVLAACILPAAHADFTSVKPTAPAAPLLPVLNWQQRSDWINVKTSVKPAAVGDGVHDDTAAIQAALNRIQDGYRARTKTVYLPAGTYKISKTLVLTKILGGMIVGNGRSTRLVWAGAPNGTMYQSNGAGYTRYIGLTWDGRSLAGVGVDHQPHTYTESRVRHQDEAFLNFRNAGIRVGYHQTAYTSEVMYRNCLFQNSGNGVSLLAWNSYDNEFDGCAFLDCHIAINCFEGNVCVSDCNFMRSKKLDLFLCTQGHSIRRSTSVGSKQFILTPFCYGPINVTVEDCHVDGWTGSQGAICFGSRGPSTIFDSAFTHPPDRNPPIRMMHPGDSTGFLTICNNAAPDSSQLIYAPSPSKIIPLPVGERANNLPDINRSFFKSVEDVSGAILDVKTKFGAKGDAHTDDTAAILAAIAAAKKQGGGATVYFPPGEYMVYSTLPITGGGYKIEGAGLDTAIHWCGSKTGAVFSVQDPQGVTLAQMRIWSLYNSVARIQQTSADNGTKSMITYDGIYVSGAWLDPRNKGRVNGHIYPGPHFRGIEMVGLPSQATVHFLHLDGTVNLHDCSRATILISMAYQGDIHVDGADYEKSGFAGCQIRLGGGSPCDQTVGDNQDFVITDYYCEQTQASLSATGDGAYLGQPGHVTIQATRNATYGPPITINDYEGRVTFIGSQMDGTLPHAVVHSGTRPVEIDLLGHVFWAEDPLFQLGSGAHLVLLQNILYSKTDIVPNALPGMGAQETAKLLADDVECTSNPGPLTNMAAALDDFRQLGALDLALNHP